MKTAFETLNTQEEGKLRDCITHLKTFRLELQDPNGEYKKIMPPNWVTTVIESTFILEREARESIQECEGRRKKNEKHPKDTQHTKGRG